MYEQPISNKPLPKDLLEQNCQDEILRKSFKDNDDSRN